VVRGLFVNHKPGATSERTRAPAQTLPKLHGVRAEGCTPVLWDAHTAPTAKPRLASCFAEASERFSVC
jgi:hypothetical protein